MLQVRFLLNNLSGEAKPGRLLAIMGPSGSGKTTLLNVLAGQLVASPRLHLSGLLEFNGQPRANKTYKYVVSLADVFTRSYSSSHIEYHHSLHLVRLLQGCLYTPGRSFLLTIDCEGDAVNCC